VSVLFLCVIDYRDVSSFLLLKVSLGNSLRPF